MDTAPDGVDMDAAGLGRPLLNIGDLLRGVHRGLGIGHTGHGGDAAAGGRRGTGENVLFIGETRVPQVTCISTRPGLTTRPVASITTSASV